MRLRTKIILLNLAIVAIIVVDLLTMILWGWGVI